MNSSSLVSVAALINTPLQRGGRAALGASNRFNDGHAEARKSQTIDPPANPADGSARALVNSQYWDPLQRAGPR
ncbi:MAG TPA: hypothetical protein VJA21_01850 [Verrucomicrobiae bacterium]